MTSALTIAKKRFLAPPHLRLLLPRLFSLSAIPNLSFTVNDYLVSTFNIAPATAARISKPITHLKSPRNPDAVRSFLHDQGFSEAEIKTMVTRRSSILCSSPENTLAPKLRALREMNLSTHALNQIILSDPEALQLSSAVHKINFWRDFICGHEAALVKLFNKNRGLLHLDTAGGIATKISFLQSHGISTNDIRRILCTVSSFINTSVSRMEDVLKRAKELGFHPQSGMFVEGLRATASLSRLALQKKMELLKSFGWSETDFFSALRKAPTMICLSEENLRSKMDFLLGEVKLDLSYITFRPLLLSHSLDKKLRPRYHVLRLLESKKIIGKTMNFYNVICLSNNKFVDKYILPHVKEIPELHEVYLTASSSDPDKPSRSKSACPKLLATSSED